MKGEEWHSCYKNVKELSSVYCRIQKSKNPTAWILPYLLSEACVQKNIPKI